MKRDTTRKAERPCSRGERWVRSTCGRWRAPGGWVRQARAHWGPDLGEGAGRCDHCVRCSPIPESPGWCVDAPPKLGARALSRPSTSPRASSCREVGATLARSSPRPRWLRVYPAGRAATGRRTAANWSLRARARARWWSHFETIFHLFLIPSQFPVAAERKREVPTQWSNSWHLLHLGVQPAAGFPGPAEARTGRPGSVT